MNKKLCIDYLKSYKKSIRRLYRGIISIYK